MSDKAYIVVLITGEYEDAWPRPLAVVIGNEDLAKKIALEATAILKPIGRRHAELQAAWIGDKDDNGDGPAWSEFHEYENQIATIAPYGIEICHAEAGDSPRVIVSEVPIVNS